MKELVSYAKEKFNVDSKLVLVYVIIYFTWGLCMNYFGSYMQIARFTYWWQIITCYIVFMIPVSLLLRGLPFHAQYAYGLWRCLFVSLVVMPYGVRMLTRIICWINFSARKISAWAWHYFLRCIFRWAIGALAKYMQHCLKRKQLNRFKKIILLLYQFSVSA